VASSPYRLFLPFSSDSPFDHGVSFNHSSAHTADDGVENCCGSFRTCVSCLFAVLIECILTACTDSQCLCYS